MKIGKTGKETGRQAEQFAERYLKEKGLQLIDSNYRCRGGEIDLIMQDTSSLVFVEVRYRKHHCYGGALASVDWRKQQRLILAAQHYLQKVKRNDTPCRFDVVALSPGASGELSVEWIRNAFEMG